MASIFNLINTGGAVVAILFVFSVVGGAVVFVKLWQHWGARSIYAKNLDRSIWHLEQGDMSQARLLLGNYKNPRRELIDTGLRLMDKAHWSSADIRDELSRIARQVVARMGGHLRVLEVIAITAPLLGLLGTVLGMIEAFKAMEAAGAQVNPAVLSGGIWKALLTTAVGLGVAIPASLCNSWFERRSENLALLLADDIGRLVKASNDRHLAQVGADGSSSSRKA